METGILYIIATPIGNLEDITLRALNVLRNDVSLLFCEDTRQSRRLVQHHSINLPLQALHTHSADRKIQQALELLRRGESIGYVTDCGTPGLSDPGNRLVAAARNEGFTVVPIPGPAALTALFSVTGFPGKRIIFGGFLSKKEGRRRRELEELGTIEGTIIIYESPHRIDKTLASIAAVLPEKQVIIGREMTKRFEEFATGTAEELLTDENSFNRKGEFALAIDNN